jgi:hypothetical protein
MSVNADRLVEKSLINAGNYTKQKEKEKRTKKPF